jgi:hypothetical protein
MMIETDTLLVNCPHCGTWPMAAASLPKPNSAQSEVRFLCPRCRHQEGGWLRRAGNVQRLAASAGGNVSRDAMRIRAHSESHVVDLDDGSRWQVFPGDIGLTLDWKPETNLAVIRIDGEISSHALVGAGQRVRVIPAGESWPVGRVKSALKESKPRPDRRS